MSKDFEKSYLVIDNPEYQARFNLVRGKFGRLLQKATSYESYEPLGIGGYTAIQEQAAVLALGVVTSPELLKLSHCAHRAVSACCVQQFEQEFDHEMTRSILEYITETGRLGAVWLTGEGTFLIAHGTNNWFDSSHMLPQDQLLDCKLMPGSPLEVKRANLIHLDQYAPMHDLSHIDSACPKRTKGSECRIIHAEKSAFIFSQLLRYEFDLPSSKKTILASTWVPCGECLGLVVGNSDYYSPEIDVFSVFMGRGDEEDSAMVNQIQGILQRETIGRLSGPYVALPKDPGYGWVLTRAGIIGDIRNKVSPWLDNPIVGKLFRLLDRALELAES